MLPVLNADPAAEFRHRHAQWSDAFRADRASDRLLSLVRGTLFLLGLLTAFVLLALKLPFWILSIPVVAFFAVLVIHGKTVTRLGRSQRAIDYYDRSLARLEDRWRGTGPTGDRYNSPAHLYSGDLDLFGNGSLFQLISQAQTRLGEDTLANWLLEPVADAAVIQQRQQAVRALSPRLDLREEFALLQSFPNEALNQQQLADWVDRPSRPIPAIQRVTALAMSVASISALVVWMVGAVSVSVPLILLTFQGLILFQLRHRLMEQIRDADRAGSGLKVLAEVFVLMERELIDKAPPESLLLRTIRDRLQTGGGRSSEHIARLNRRIQTLTNAVYNQFFAPIAYLLGLPIHLLHSIETWRRDIGPHVTEWLVSVGEFEALLSISSHASAHPGDVWPEIVVGNGPLFDATGLGHPLLAASACVRNNVCLDSSRKLIMISGSNMSGKSTLLRTIGVNLVLTMAGGPARATRLRVSPLQLATAMRINDSLQEGKSLFYSVVSRMKEIVVRSNSDRSLPVLFLLDEILQGTNSHDRRVGSEGIIRRLVESGAIGLVTTHDLALTDIVASFEGAAINAHFEDQLVDGRMSFDYQLRPGIVQKSNALELMRMMGLDV